MKYRLWLNTPDRRVRMISNDLDGPYDAEILMHDLLKAIPDAVAGIDIVESRSVGHRVGADVRVSTQARNKEGDQSR